MDTGNETNTICSFNSVLWTGTLCKTDVAFVFLLQFSFENIKR